MPVIKIGDEITLTWEGSDQREVRKIIDISGGGVQPEGHGYIRDDLPVWNDVTQQWRYCYGEHSGS